MEIGILKSRSIDWTHALKDLLNVVILIFAIYDTFSDQIVIYLNSFIYKI